MTMLTQETLLALLANAPNYVVIVDRDGTIQYLNQTEPETGDTVVGRSQYEFIAPEYIDGAKNAIEAVFTTGESSEYETRTLNPDGTTSCYSNLAGPIRRDGEVAAVSIFALDITDRKAAEESLRQAKDELIEQQSRALQELSTPVIKVWHGVLVLPLIGTVDTARGQQITENLLQSIVTTQASVAIIDITGVPVVDTMVAGHFLKTIQAAKMLGAEVILTGVSPYNAQALVKLGVDLSQVTTKGSLEAGLKLAIERTNSGLPDTENHMSRA